MGHVIDPSSITSSLHGLYCLISCYGDLSTLDSQLFCCVNFDKDDYINNASAGEQSTDSWVLFINTVAKHVIS